MRVRTEHTYAKTPEFTLTNTGEAARTGDRSLKVHVMPMHAGERVYIYKKTYYTPEDFHDSRYDPSFSPLLYPGQTIHASACLPAYGDDCAVRLYARDASTGKVYEGESVPLKKSEWVDLSYTIPRIEGGLIDEAGLVFDMHGIQRTRADLICFVDDLYFDGKPEYTIDFSKSHEEVWTGLHREICQFTRLKGLLYLENGMLNLSCTDYAEAYTGHHAWEDYTATFALTPLVGDCHMVNVRVQGALRSYAAGLTANGKLGLYKNENGYRKLAEVDCGWEPGRTYSISVTALGNRLTIGMDGCEKIVYTDENSPYLAGAIGVSVQDGSRCAYKNIEVK
jgi:hypothetical protein